MCAPSHLADWIIFLFVICRTILKWESEFFLFFSPMSMLWKGRKKGSKQARKETKAEDSKHFNTGSVYTALHTVECKSSIKARTVQYITAHSIPVRTGQYLHYRTCGERIEIQIQVQIQNTFWMTWPATVHSMECKSKNKFKIILSNKFHINITVSTLCLLLILNHKIKIAKL